MANVISVIWDFDKTLIDGYMQTPLFKDYNVDEKLFWKEVNELPDEYEKMDVQVNKDTVYLNHLIRYVKDGKMPGLNNDKLKEYGKKQVFYPGVIDFIKSTQTNLYNSDLNRNYGEYDIKVEHYIVSTGIKKIIEGTELADIVSGIWGCELIDAPINADMDKKAVKEISEVGYTIDNTTKTRALFEINKGIPQNPDIDVNAKMPEDARRVKFHNMIYIADGPSDIPAFSVVNRFGGATFAVYPKENQAAFDQVERLREDGRINMYAEADFRKGTTAYMWVTHKIKKLADKMYDMEKSKINSSVSFVPRHLT